MSLYELNNLSSVEYDGEDITHGYISRVHYRGGIFGLNATAYRYHAIRELRVLVLGGVGLSVSQTAHELLLSPRSIENHRGSAYGGLPGERDMAPALQRCFTRRYFAVEQPVGDEVNFAAEHIDILAGLAHGLSTKQIADGLHYSLHTLRNSVAELKEVQGVANVAEAVTYCNMASVDLALPDSLHEAAQSLKQA